jgi:hypothetical protein
VRAVVTPQAGNGVAVVSGTGQAGAQVQILVNSQVAGSTAVGSNGNWTATVPLGEPGQYRITVRAVVNDTIVNSANAPVNVAVPAPLPTPTPTIPSVALELVSPNDGDSGTAERIFEWATSYVPREGEGFELVFWLPGQNPMTAGFGLAAPTADLRIRVNLTKLDDVLGPRLEPGAYQWGVLLVQREPYTRLRLLGEPRTFHYFRAGDSGSSGGGGQGSGGGESSGE